MLKIRNRDNNRDLTMAVTRACLIALVVAAAGGAAGTSEQRRRQVRSLLKRLNKDALATIQSADGDIIDCVPISKQPALDHPLLKNHTIQVYPELYGDTYTRLFIYWTRDAYRSTGCYNLQCSGFIQTNNQIAIGGNSCIQIRWLTICRYGGSQYEITILIWKDPKGGNWWLQVGNHTLGYWPSTIFSYLQISASYVMWGGEVYSPYADQTSTDMGSGHFPGEGLSKASYIRNIQVVDPFNKLSSPNVVGLGNKQPNCYNVESGTNGVNWGTYIFYGAPGKNPSCP